MVLHQQASVKPRVVSPETNSDLLLEDVIAERVAAGDHGAIELWGGPGAGKSTALAHLAALEFSDQVYFLDDARPQDVRIKLSDRLVVYTTRKPLNLTDACYQLAPWTRDDVIEFLLATHPNRCSSVITRVTSDRDQDMLYGAPALWCMVSEQMVANDDVTNIRAALRLALADQAAEQRTLEDARFYASALLLKQRELAEGRAREMIQRDVNRQFVRLLSFPLVQTVLAADRVIALLKENQAYPFPTYKLPQDLVLEVARLVQTDPVAMERLLELFGSSEELYMPMLASVLHAVDPSWRPRSRNRLHLSGAFLTEAAWSSLNLRRADLSYADLSQADLQDAYLQHACLEHANLRDIKGSGLHGLSVRAAQANFDFADLSQADLTEGRFTGTTFVQANLQGAKATAADFVGADFSGANLQDAVFQLCNLRHANLQDADLQDADLRDANLWEQSLRTTKLIGANLEAANLGRCDLEFVEWPLATLCKALLDGAYLTGSRMLGADFRLANLQRSGLADVDWEGADLRGADLRGCSFHMGSSRSGLVDSPYPSHGTRTGFYTNDFNDKVYRPPEEIRKANLCGADLRGAKIEDTDFYLVDLRGAIYDADQARHFRRCDAILVNSTQ